MQVGCCLWLHKGDVAGMGRESIMSQLKCNQPTEAHYRLPYYRIPLMVKKTESITIRSRRKMLEPNNIFV
jgi:hypothetical protein